MVALCEKALAAPNGVHINGLRHAEAISMRFKFYAYRQAHARLLASTFGPGTPSPYQGLAVSIEWAGDGDADKMQSMWRLTIAKGDSNALLEQLKVSEF